MANNTKKGIDTGSNLYIIIYSAVLCIVVAFCLAFVSSALKDRQEANVSLDKKKQILASLNIRDLASDSEAEARYKAVVVADDILNADGTVATRGSQGGTSAGFLCNGGDYKAGRLALYRCTVDGETKYVFPVFGMGLWGSIWGYVAVNADKQTVYGAYFNHEGETAGLGAEIKDNTEWQQAFSGKKLFAAGQPDKVALAVVKKTNVKDPSTECDAITGATLTSDGVSHMLQECLTKYMPFLAK